MVLVPLEIGYYPKIYMLHLKTTLSVITVKICLPSCYDIFQFFKGAFNKKAQQYTVYFLQTR